MSVDKQRQAIAGWQAGLEARPARIDPRFRRAEVRDRVRRYLLGLLSPVELKNGWQLAEELGEPGPQGVQRLLNAAHWDADAVRDDLQAYVVEHLGDPSGVLVVDETGFLKKGTKSVGVQRQYSGTAGRIENCQIGVFMVYASDKGRTFLDRELYLPRVWADDAVRRNDAGVPLDVAFATKPQLARRMLERAVTAGVPAAWLTGDEIYGNDTELRRWLEQTGRAYVLAVSCNHTLWPDGIQERADVLVSGLPQAAWGPRSCGTGSQGERRYDWAAIHLTYPSEPGTAHWLLARRSLSDPAEVAYLRAFGPEDTAVRELIRVAGMRWAIEESFADAKGVLGIATSPLPSWPTRTWKPPVGMPAKEKEKKGAM